MTHQQRVDAASLAVRLLAVGATPWEAVHLSTVADALTAYARLANSNAKRNHRRNTRRDEAKAKAMGRTA